MRWDATGGRITPSRIDAADGKAACSLPALPAGEIRAQATPSVSTQSTDVPCLAKVEISLWAKVQESVQVEVGAGRAGLARTGAWFSRVEPSSE